MEYTKPEYQCELLPNYPNEEAAIKEQEKKAKEFYIFVSKKYEQELKYPTDDNPRLHKIQVNAIKSLLEQERILVRSTHNRNFNPEEALEMIRKHWGDKSLKEYAKSNNVEVTIYHISKF
ncbi:MAG: hypothetical protein K2K79_08050 [Paramuribaculum sp.]|nr:hypothetical protein [Paramuribaculum sp.]